MKKGLIFVNFKSYKESVGKNAVKLAKELNHKRVYLIVNAVDLKSVINAVKYSKVFVEHIDPVEFGKFTGAITFPEIKQTKAYGILVNHSEKKLKFEEIKKEINLAKKYHLKIIVCSSDLSFALKIAVLKPDFVAIESEELISGKKSITQENPALIKTASECIKNLLVGAGIHSKEDVKKARELGAKGILISSAIIKAKNRKEKIKELLDA